MIEARKLLINEKKTTPITWYNIVTPFSVELVPEISPYPTVVIVVVT
jgi:hypothetical protein